MYHRSDYRHDWETIVTSDILTSSMSAYDDTKGAVLAAAAAIPCPIPLSFVSTSILLGWVF
jgi:hypothetical protein